MLSLEEAREIIMTSTKEVLAGRIEIEPKTIFTGPGSSIESIEIVQIIAAIEERLEEKGIEGYDLFDEIFKIEVHTLDSLAELIQNGI